MDQDGRLPHDGGPDLHARRRGTPARPTPHDVDLCELDHPLPADRGPL